MIRRKFDHRGMSLAEVLVAALLMLVVLLLAYSFFHYGASSSEVTRTTVEVQQAANVATYRMSRELIETNPVTLEFFPNTAYPDAPVGMVFLSARDDDGTFQYHDVSGRPIWQKAVGYFLDADRDFEGDNVVALYRAEVVPTGLPGADPVPVSTLGVTTQDVLSDGENRQVVAHGLLAPSTDEPRGGFDVYSELEDGTKTYDASRSPVLMDLEMINYTSGKAAQVAGQDNSNSLVSHLRLELRN